MKDNSRTVKEKQYKITVRATAKQRDAIQKNASQANSSMNDFFIMAALSYGSSCKKDIFLQSQRLIRLQRMIDDIEDQTVQSELRKECENVWHIFASLTKATSTETVEH